MKQYYSVKASHPDAVLLFRVGDFYETFGEDAIRTSEILGITLTKRANGAAASVELAGFPHHALDNYLPKLVRAGQRVAICEQLEDPKLAKKIVKRGITELVTPGVTYNENVLDIRENNFLASIYMDHQILGIAFLDISTGEFLTSQGDQAFIDKLLASFKPKEVLVQRTHQKLFQDLFGQGYYTFPLEEWVYTEENARNKLQHQFGTQNLKGFGVQDINYGIIASGAILQYLAQKTGQFWPAEGEAHWRVTEWLMWQMGGLGPMLGQVHHFVKFNKGKAPYAEERYAKEAKRLYGVLDRRLAEVEYVAGDYSIADMSIWPWISRFEWQGIDLNAFPEVARWYKAIADRPAVQRGYHVPVEQPGIPMP